jgi:ribosomal protein S18 acetylase RimI-like enzyme
MHKKDEISMNSTVKLFQQAESNFFSLVQTHKLDSSNIIAFTTGVPVSNLNPAIVHHVDSKFQTCLDACDAFYASHQMPWALVVRDYFCDNSVTNLLQNNGFDLNDEGVAMHLALQDLEPPTLNSQLDIKRMEQDLKIWSIPLVHGFESVPAITGIYTDRHQRASQYSSAIYHFSGFIKESIICSLTLSIGDNYARLDDVATMPSYQKQGFATTLIYAALKKLLELNIYNCYLEASSSGLSVYKKLGFTPIFKNFYYEKN